MGTVCTADGNAATSSESLPRCLRAEKNLFAAAGVSVDAYDVAIPAVTAYGDAAWLHTIEVQGDSEPLVIIPGYMASAALWVRVITQLGRHCYVVDPLGTGLSARPDWIPQLSASKTEEWFAESLEAWRAAVGLDSFALAGHSLGACIATAYAERFPTRVSRLVLLSPVGMPSRPDGYEEHLRSSGPISMRAVYTLWRHGWTPHDVLRWTSKMCSRAATATATRWHRGSASPEYLEAVIEYLEATWSEGSPSGARAITSFLFPGAWARHPLGARLPKLTMRVECIYGTQDWMDFRHAENISGVGLRLVEGAGHQMHMDRPLACAEATNRALDATSVEKLASTPEAERHRLSAVTACNGNAPFWRAWEGYDLGR